MTISDMPLAQIASHKQRQGWTVPFYVFLRDGSDVYRTCFTNGRGVDRLRFDMNIFDLTPLGRQKEWEDSPDGWPRTEAHFAVSRSTDRTNTSDVSARKDCHPGCCQD